MAETATVRAEIKAWEYQFKADNGRPPSVQDIRENPDIAAKYKLYKKLTKSSQPSLPKAPPAQSTPPLRSFNPFSPQKNKGQQKSSKADRAPQNVLDDPFTSADQTSGSHPLILPPPNPELSRARKRLRGEPTSPSPQKRPRVAFNSVSFRSQNQQGSALDDSPVKSAVGTKSFRLLFEDRPTIKPPVFTTDGAKKLKPEAKEAHKRLIPTKSTLHGTLQDSEPSQESNPAPKRRPSESSNDLIPPSPPPSELVPGNPKGKEKFVARKKARTESDEDDEDDGYEPQTVKVVQPVASYMKHKHVTEPEVLPAFTSTHSLETEGGDNVEINLPEKLKQMLAVSQPDVRVQSLEAGRIVSALLYGTREGHYDPVKGGEIWDIGEESLNDDAAGDDWEGEPVPWEVGELE